MATSFQESQRFATLNLRCFSVGKRQYQLDRLLIGEQPNLIALQETKMFNNEQIELNLQRFLDTYEVCVTYENGFSDSCFLFIAKSVQQPTK